MKEIRTLRAEEIECRVSTVKTTGVSLLLYKDARCDMNILDEIVGPMRWSRSHSRDNANCTVSIYDEEIGQWISKEDTGKESFTEKEKGLPLTVLSERALTGVLEENFIPRRLSGFRLINVK